MNRGRKAASTLSSKVTRFNARGPAASHDQNQPPKPGRTVRSMATAVKERDEHEAKRRKILGDLLDSRKRAEEPRDRDESAADDEWEDFSAFDFPDPLAGAAAGNGEPDSVQAGGVGTFVPSSLPYKPRIDTRTRAEQIKKQDDAWAELLPQAVDAYLAWKHGEREQPNNVHNGPTGAQNRATAAADVTDDPPADGMDVARDDEAGRDAERPALDPPQHTGTTQPPTVPSIPLGGDWFTVAAIRDTDFQRDWRVEQAAGEHPVLSVIRAGMMPCSPVIPSVAISMGILELYYRVRSHAPRLGIQPFVRGLCDKYMCHYRPYLREQFALAFDMYLAVQRE
ncbi:hypothetical protein EXIGLDRAFT_703421, partial [Exidia glandulosa HHB12029]